MSTKQTLREYVTNTEGCDQCDHYDGSGVFEVCRHRLADYRYEGRDEAHTIQHMREKSGQCGLNRALFAKRV